MSQQPPPQPQPEFATAAPIDYASAYAQHVKDAAHLRTLSICHYVWGPLVMVFSSIFLIHVAIGIAMVSGAFAPANNQTGVPPPAWMGWLFIGMGGAAVALGWTIGILSILSGRFMSTRRNRTFSLIVAGLNCLQMPLGTVLGVFTFVVLLRDSVKAEYRGNGR